MRISSGWSHAQSHRGPDANGLHVSVSGRAGLGHNRLTIIDLSDAGLQPMSTPDGRLWIVFNGEIYNYLELRAELTTIPSADRPTPRCCSPPTSGGAATACPASSACSRS